MIGDFNLEGLNGFYIRCKVDNPYGKHHDYDNPNVQSERVYRFQIPKSDVF